VFLPCFSVITGEATRTPDLRIMRPQPAGRKAKAGKEVATHQESLVPTQCPESARMTPELAELVDAWPSLPEATKATILTLIRAARKDGAK
jgi:hypothetical protein